MTSIVDSQKVSSIDPARKTWNKWVFCFLGFFFILFWFPDVANYPFYNFYSLLTGKTFNFLQYIWIPETDLIFAGHHHPSPSFIWEEDVPLAYEALAASIILSIILSFITILADQKWYLLSRIQTLTYPYFYVLTAKFTALFMFIGGLTKVFPLQFSQITLSPDSMMLPTGSSQAYPLIWIAFGFSEYYEMILGALEIIGAILLWIPRTTVIGAILTTIIMVNVVLLDIFGDTGIRIIPTLLLLACIFLFWKEITYFVQYCTKGIATKHVILIYSLAQTTSQYVWRAIFRTLSAIIGVLSIIIFSNEMFGIYQAHQRDYANPFYGVWDSLTPGIYLDNYSLQTIGIINQGNRSEISLYTFDGNGMPKNIDGIYKDHQVYFSITNTQGKNILVSAEITPSHELIVHFNTAGQPKEYHYRHRTVISRRQIPHFNL